MASKKKKLNLRFFVEYGSCTVYSPKRAEGFSWGLGVLSGCLK